MISIGLPAFKKDYLKESLDSILNQTYSDFELIIINDQSPDNLDDLISTYSDPRFIYIKNEVNLGPIGNWNKCLELAKGEYFVLFSDDDIFEPTFLEKLVLNFSQNSKASLIHCRVNIIDADGNSIKIAPSCKPYETAQEFILKRLKGERNFYAPGFMVRTSDLKSIGGFVDFPLAWFSDDATWYQMANIGGVAFVDEILCKWRYSNSNISNVGNAELRIIAGLNYLSWFKEFVLKLNLNTHQVGEYVSLAQKWVNNNKINCIIRASGKGLKGTIKSLKTWWTLKNKYGLSVYDLFRIIYHVNR